MFFFGAQDSETIRADSQIPSNCNSGDVPHHPEGVELDTETKQFDNRYMYDQVNSAFISLPQYLFLIHSRQDQKHFQDTANHKTEIRALHL